MPPAWLNEQTKVEVINALFDALPPDRKVNIYNAPDQLDWRANCIAHYTDHTWDDQEIIEWYERALMGVKTEEPAST